jgi:hypothetical protein
MEKPKRCPFAEWEKTDKTNKKVIDLESSKCYYPAVFVDIGIPKNFVTPGFFRCPECYTNGGDYLNCDFFSSLWWHKFGGRLRPKKATGNKRRPLPKAIRHEVFKKDNYKCVECGKSNKETTLHADHIIPVSLGGTDELDNLQTLCEECNTTKSDRILSGVKKNGK